MPNRETDSGDAAYLTLKREIITGRRKPGEVFREKDFAAAQGVSRTPVHEAVLRLADEGLLVVMPRQGTVVSHISMADVAQLYQARRLLEPSVAALAAGADGARDPAQAWADYFSVGAPPGAPLPGGADPGVYPDEDAVFHLFLAEAVGNRFLCAQVRELMSLTQRVRCLSSAVRRDRAQAARREHAAIAAAVAARDPDATRAAMLAHLESAEAGYLGLAGEHISI